MMTSTNFTGTNVKLEVEVKPTRRPAFLAEYQQRAGVPADPDYVQSQHDKWGAEYRAYFDASLAEVTSLRQEGFNVEDRTTGYGSDRAWRINKAEFFWALVQQGYRLGENP